MYFPIRTPGGPLRSARHLYMVDFETPRKSESSPVPQSREGRSGPPAASLMSATAHAPLPSGCAPARSGTVPAQGEAHRGRTAEDRTGRWAQHLTHSYMCSADGAPAVAAHGCSPDTPVARQRGTSPTPQTKVTSRIEQPGKNHAEILPVILAGAWRGSRPCSPPPQFVPGIVLAMTSRTSPRPAALGLPAT